MKFTSAIRAGPAPVDAGGEADRKRRLGRRTGMTAKRATLHLVCGKIASGKSTLAARLAGHPGTILLSEDQLLSTLYPGEIATLEDYVRCATRLREAVAPLIVRLLEQGLSVVLDFQTSTPEARAWSRRLFEAAKADHRLYYLEASNALCKQRVAARNASGTHPYTVNEADYELFTRYFQPPTAAEGFNLVSMPAEAGVGGRRGRA